MISQDAIDLALAPLLMRRMSPAERRYVATALEAAARQQREIADAETRQQARPAAERVTPTKRGAGPGRAPARFVRIETETTRGSVERLRLYVGRGLWYELGSPQRIDVQRIGGVLHIRPASGDAGFALTAGSGIPRCYIDGARDLVRLADGKYSGEVRGGAIIVGGLI